MNIFYTQVDTNLQEELNARGRTGFQNRTTKAIDFMVGKIANVEIVAYETSSSLSAKIAVLGGRNVQIGRYLPSGPEGYLTDYSYKQESIDFYTQDDVSIAQTNAGLSGKTTNASVGDAYLKQTKLTDRSRRTGPYITTVDVTIGDHSMGLLNKATVSIVIPNVARDLDNIEDAWFRPGRYVSIRIEHPETAVVTRTVNNAGTVTGGLLAPKTLPNPERIKELYPAWDVDKFLKQYSKMNAFIFEGLITSFDFSYTADGTVEATLSLTGTSNVYSDVSMFLTDPKKNEKDSTKTTNTENFKVAPTGSTIPSLSGVGPDQNVDQLIELIYNRIETIIDKFKLNCDAANSFTDFILPFSLNDSLTQHNDLFLLAGNQTLPKIKSVQIPDAKSEYKYAGNIKNKIIQVAKLDKTERAKALSIPASGSTPAIPRDPASIPDASTLIDPFTGAAGLPTLTADSTIGDVNQVVQILSFNGLITAEENERFVNDLDRANREFQQVIDRATKQDMQRDEFIKKFNTSPEATYNFNRYITLGALIYIINEEIIKKAATPGQLAQIIHTDELCFSNYYPRLVSTRPEDILFLPEKPDAFNDMNSYGTDPAVGLVYYKNVVKQFNDTGLSRESLKNSGFKPWPGVYKKADSSTGVMYPSRIFINIESINRIINAITAQGKNAFTIKTFIANISDLVSKCSGNAIDLKLVSYPDDQNKLLLADTRYLKSKNETVIPYSVPMFANHPNGSVVLEFSFTAKLPENVKNLSYVLNQGDTVTEEQIAPYMNFMYNSKNPEQVNKALNLYREKFNESIKQLEDARINYGASPGVPERARALYKAITSYIKYPTNDIKTSQQITAPIFPFEVKFTIDGINGLRYGDVLTFDALPSKYRENTVFSVIGLTHTVSTEGDWRTEVRCIMRPSID